MTTRERFNMYMNHQIVNVVFQVRHISYVETKKTKDQF